MADDIGDLKKKLDDAVKKIKADKKQKDKWDNISGITELIQKDLKGLPEEFTRLSDCIKEMSTIKDDVKTYNSNQSGAKVHAQTLNKLCSNSKDKSKEEEDICEVASALLKLKDLEVK